MPRFSSSFISMHFIAITRYALLLLIIFSFSITNVAAQAPGMLEFAGKTTKDNKALSGAVVTVYRLEPSKQEKQEEIKTGRNGKFDFNLVFGFDYKMTFTYPGCVDMSLMVYTSKLPKTRSDLFPLYQTEIPFFETNNTTVRISKYKSPFTKVIYDGKKAFKDDEAYLTQFTSNLLIDPVEQAKELAEKEKAERDRLDAIEKAKRDAEEKALAEQKAREEAALKEAELARLKQESANKKEDVGEEKTMEPEIVNLQREKEIKATKAKKNKEIKTNYENDLLKIVADNERLTKEKSFSKQKSEARANTVINQMRSEASVKGQSEKLREEQKLKLKKAFENQQYKNNEVRKLVEASAFAERAVRISHQKSLPDVRDYSPKPLPNVAVSVKEGFFKTVRTTVITSGKKMDIYRKEIYFWGSVYWYKNDKDIDEVTYNVEIAFFSSYIQK